MERENGGLYLFGEQLYLLPKDMPSLHTLKVLRCGLHLGTLKKNRFEPSHALALALKPQEVQHVWKLSATDAQTVGYLNGQTLTCDDANLPKGWYLITVDGYSLGWGKLAGQIMKNHYPKGLRNHETQKDNSDRGESCQTDCIICNPDFSGKSVSDII